MVKSIRIKFDKMYGETPKAVLVGFLGGKHWLPRSLCRNFILNKKLGGNVIIPTFIYEKITGETVKEVSDISYGEASWVIEKHVPVKVKAFKVEPSNDLLR